jgi:Holliday junction DNA helicase RuvA
MISSVRGKVLHAAASTVVIEVGGIGLAMHVTPQLALALRVGAEASVRTALIVREDDLSLYGFATVDELAVFDLLRGVTGVGPKSALAVLSVLTPGQVATAVAVDDDAAFRKVSGIGPKTAKLIVLSLAGKLALPQETRVSGEVPRVTVAESVTVALVGLGWPERVASQAVEDARSIASPAELDAIPALLRLALSTLGPRAGVNSP